MEAKVYYKIGEVAEMFKVNASLVRYWEKEFSIIRPKKSQKGTRMFTNRDIDNFRIIHELVKVKGMTIQGAKDFMDRKKDEKDFQKVDVINTLHRTKNMLKQIKDMLDHKA